MEYEIDYDHVINKKINGVNVVVYFSKNRNEKIKDMVLDILMNSYAKRVQDYMKRSSQMAWNVV